MTATLPPAAPVPTARWLLEPQVGLCACAPSGRRRKGTYVTRTIDAAAGVVRAALFAEDAAAQPGLLQRLDARVKLVTLLGLLVAVSLVQQIPVLVVAYAATLVLAVLSKLPLGAFVRRVWLAIPLFTGIVVLPATLNLITKGHVVVPLGSWFGHRVGMTAPGLTGAARIVLRVATSVSVAVLLTTTTRWTRLLAALRALLVPRMFVLVLGVAYRYLFHLLGSVTDMYEARRARTVGAEDGRSGRAFVAASAGALFGKSHQLAEEVHQAMVARGYVGDARTLSAFRLRALDVAWIAVAVVAAGALVGLDRGL
ncbi:MAG: cobalt transporter, inner rane subunit CbiQ [Acidimicrobiales bacterium]|nr:cobalt transporter, inner rane subunit CbiQ [Acidimicrobiales bacterium]